MKAYRYNAKKREDRKFNNCGEEKNPNKVQFFATNMAYADRYKNITSECGEVLYVCDLEVKEIENVNLFDMNANFKSLNIFNSIVESEIQGSKQLFQEKLASSKTKKEAKIWENNLKNLEARPNEIAQYMINMEFQELSDFDNQNILIAELKSLGFDGYITTNEIAIF